MAVSASAIASDFKALFSQMKSAAASAPKSDDWYADQLGALIAKHIKTAAVPASAVIVKVTGGSGAPAVGTPNPDEINVV